MIKNIFITPSAGHILMTQRPVIGSPAVQGAELSVSWSDEHFTPMMSKGNQFDCGAVDGSATSVKGCTQLSGLDAVKERKVVTMRY